MYILIWILESLMKTFPVIVQNSPQCFAIPVVISTVAFFFFLYMCGFFIFQTKIVCVKTVSCNVLCAPPSKVLHGYLYMPVYIDFIVFNICIVSSQAFRLFLVVVTVFDFLNNTALNMVG